MLKKVLEYFHKRWYSIFRIDDRRIRKSEVISMEGIFDARSLACYIIDKYNKFTNGAKEISNIKLQKALYFLLAYWGGFVRKGQMNDSEEKLEANAILFSNEIQAWVYGPVVPDVFHAKKDGILDNYKLEDEKLREIFDSVPMLEETIDSLLGDIFPVADFKLVSTSHEDKSWINHFDMDDLFHNEPIPQEEIIQEYTLRDAI